MNRKTDVKLCAMPRPQLIVCSGQDLFASFFSSESGLCQLDYQLFASFEWEKKWHPEVTDAKIALLHFTRWFRENWET